MKAFLGKDKSKSVRRLLHQNRSSLVEEATRKLAMSGNVSSLTSSAHFKQAHLIRMIGGLKTETSEWDTP